MTKGYNNDTAMTVEQDALEPTKMTKKEWKRKQHSIKMVGFRAKKKAELQRLRDEHRYLEDMSKLKLSVMPIELLLDGGGPTHEKLKQLWEATVAVEALRDRKKKLRGDVMRHNAFQQWMLNLLQRPALEEKPMLPTSGSWVRFPNGAAPFYFVPLAPEEVEADTSPFSFGFAPDLPDEKMVGTLLGWNVYREMALTDETRGMQRMRLTKRLGCSIDKALTVSAEHEKHVRPVLVSPEGWGWNGREEVFFQVLQEVDADTRVMIQDIPGPVSVRYIFLGRTAQWELPGGRRKVGFSMKIVDSTANRRSRAAESPQETIRWITEGWARFMLTEIDDNTIDVVYDHCAAYQTESEATELVTQWARSVLTWERFIFPSNLVHSE